MTDSEIKAKLQDRSVMALTIWGESRGSTVEARVAVGCVIRNRQRWPSHFMAADGSEKSVCFAPKQFSCWNGADANYAAIMAQAERIVTGVAIDDPVLKECFFLTDGIREHVLLDNTHGATFYLETGLLQTKPPMWVSRVQVATVIGPFSLFREQPAKAIT